MVLVHLIFVSHDVFFKVDKNFQSISPTYENEILQLIY